MYEGKYNDKHDIVNSTIGVLGFDEVDYDVYDIIMNLIK